MRKVDLFTIDDADDALKELNRIAEEQTAKGLNGTEEQQLLRSIRNKFELLKADPQYGDKIPRKLWPKPLVERYQIDNLWRVELTNYWRMLYTLRTTHIDVVCFVLKIFDHKDYDKLFGYRKK